MLDECFLNYRIAEIPENMVFMCNKVHCKIDKNSKFIVPRDCELRYETECYSTDKIKAGDVVGNLRIYNQNDLLFEGKLYSINDRK